MVSDYSILLDEVSSDGAVQKVLADYVAEHNGSLGNFTVTLPKSES